MNSLKTRYLLAILFFLSVTTASENSFAQPPADQWKPTWSDEFDGDKIDAKKWAFDLGNGFRKGESGEWISGWGNEELQYYTDAPSNIFVADGMLHIRAVKEPTNGFAYSSARIKSRNRDESPLFNQKYGRFEFRAKLPTGQGVWPALWMLPQKDTYGTWAASGEIDVLEARGQNPHEILGTLHYGGQWPDNEHSGETFKLPGGQTIADFHVYTIEWEPGEIRWYFDGKQYAAQSSWWSGSTSAQTAKPPQREEDLAPWPAPFDQEFYLIMNVAVGGKFLGNPDDTTKFPAEMIVDYVRAYEKVGGYGEPKERSDENLPFKK